MLLMPPGQQGGFFASTLCLDLADNELLVAMDTIMLNHILHLL